ncbi:hypothetical protein [Streptomyces bicolor]|uniref:hypothetical protein n=1 Tax=Streptomyces bicolor TaxID=66874 RepID=UPI00131ACF50|nr:hypothetical protein [Streptomyces bicolor]
MTIVWSGYGLLTIVLYVVGPIVPLFVLDQAAGVLALGEGSAIGDSAGALVWVGLGGAENWLVGRYVNREWNEHTLFALPIQHWGMFGVFAAAVGLVLLPFGCDPVRWLLSSG